MLALQLTLANFRSARLLSNTALVVLPTISTAADIQSPELQQITAF